MMGVEVKQTGVEYHQPSAGRGFESELWAKPRPPAEPPQGHLQEERLAPRQVGLHLLCADPIIVVIYSPRSSTFHYLLRVCLLKGSQV